MDPMAAVVIVWLEDKLLRIFTGPFNEVYVLALIYCFLVPKGTSPGHVRIDRRDLRFIKQVLISFVCENGKDRFFVYQLTPEAIDHADRTLTISVEQCRML